VHRVVVVGRAGSGKTWVASEISRRTGIAVAYLDRIFWRADWQPTPRDEALAELERVVAGDEWIIDGNFFGTTGPVVYPRADTAVFIDAPRIACVRNVIARRVRDHGKQRPDLPAPEGFDWALIKDVWSWDDVQRPRLLRNLKDNLHLDVVVVRTSGDAVETLFAGE
jgi:adenylate kinase family enzyme